MSLTDKGLKAIETVGLDDKVWDGVEWVSHDGVICKGLKETIQYDGLRATADHKIYTEDGRTVSFGQAAQEMARLERTGDGWKAIRTGNYYQSEVEENQGLHPRVLSMQKCGRKTWIFKNNLLKGKTNGCQSCSSTISKHSGVLGRRYDGMVGRCRHPQNPAYQHYGARGIELRFNSRKEFILWVEQNLPHQDYLGVEIDRIDNNGHYEPGNLRLATRKEQVNNRRNTAKVLWKGNGFW